MGTGIAVAADDEQIGDGAVQAEASRLELPQFKTSTARTFQLPDGHLETRLYADPPAPTVEPADPKVESLDAQVLPGGIDAVGPGVYEAQLPEQIDAEPVRVDSGDSWVSYRLISDPAAAIDAVGQDATYQVNSDQEIRLQALPEAVKESLVLASPQQDSNFTFYLATSPGITPQLKRDGDIELIDSEGRVKFQIPAPTMIDSNPDQPAVSGAASYELTQVGDGWHLTVSANSSWLERDDLFWPVTIDPTIEPNTKFPVMDCTFGGAGDPAFAPPPFSQEGWRLCAKTGQKELFAGFKKPGATNEYSRSLLRFTYTDLPDLFTPIDITSASIGLYSPATAINTSGVEVRPIPYPEVWSESVDWSTYNGFTRWAKNGGDYSKTEGSEVLTSQRGTAAGWWVFNGLDAALEKQFDSTPGGLDSLNPGWMVKLKDDTTLECSPTCKERSVKFYSSAYTEASKRPYLAMKYYKKAPATSVVALPREGTVTGRRLPLKATWTEAGVTGVTFQYREGSTTRFKNIPSNLATDTAGKEVTWPIVVSGVKNTNTVFFDALHASAALTEKGGTVEVRALFEGPVGVEGYSTSAKATVDVDTGGTLDATSSVGPGTLDLITGNFTVSRTDVSLPTPTLPLTFARTHSSRKPGLEADTSVLGRGWTPSIPVEAAGGAEFKNVREVIASAAEKEEGLGDYALLTDLEGYEYAFEKVGETYAVPPELTGWSLTRSGATFILKDPGGSSTTFESVSGGTEYLPVAITVAGSSASNTNKMVYELVGGKRRLKMIIASTPGVECTESIATTSSRCRSLVFTYLPASSWGAPSSFGDRLFKITYYGANGKTTMLPWEVASYVYDKWGRLIEEFDPRLAVPLKEKYEYVGAASTRSGGQLKTITPPGLEPWTMEYTTLSGEMPESGRLKAVKRASLAEEGPSTAQTTIAYGVPVSGSGAPYDLSGTAVAQWGQTDLPADATAIFPPTEVPSTPPSSFTQATVYYMDFEGQLVNTATPPGAGTLAASITTSEAEEHGNITRELTAQNRLRALAAGAESATRSHELETKRQYNNDGTEMQEEWGPTHSVRLESGEVVQARRHTTIQYDAGWPGTGVKPHLPTRETVGASIVGKGIDPDQRVTETAYDWTLRKPTEVIVDPSGLNLRTKMFYDSATGALTERRSPGGEANSVKLIYYVGWKDLTNPECGSAGAYTGYLCKTSPVQPGTPGQPELTVTMMAAFSPFGKPTEVIEAPGEAALKAGTPVRKRLLTYDAIGRLRVNKIEGGGTTLSPAETVYDEKTGLPVEQHLNCVSSCEGFDSQAINIGYNKLGRATTYQDADGSLSTTTYDIMGRPKTVADGKGTQSLTYDSTTGLLTGLSDSAAGAFTASYDADGNLTEKILPNGMVSKTTYDETGAPVELSYTKTTNCSINCTWLDFDAERSVHQQVLSQTSTLSNQKYTYDKAGRLTLVNDTPTGGSCTTRLYEFDKDSNRTGLTTRSPEIGGACATSGGTKKGYSYDAGDRLTDSGIAYDNFGRITSLPAADAGGSTLTTSFYSNEMIASQSQGGITNAYQLDSSGRVRQRIQTGGKSGTEIFHYAGSSDAPIWTERAGTWERYIPGIGGELAAIQSSAAETSLQLTNLHGDVVATASLSTTATGLTATFESDEFGNPKSGSPARFGWLGGKQRRTELPSGVAQMGVRSYVPAIGRFISTDPMLGGSANSYDYANQDPVNAADLSGSAPGCIVNLAKDATGTLVHDGGSAFVSIKVEAEGVCTKGVSDMTVHIQYTGGVIRPPIPQNPQTVPMSSSELRCGSANPCVHSYELRTRPFLVPCNTSVNGVVEARAWVTWKTKSGRNRSSKAEADKYRIRFGRSCGKR